MTGSPTATSASQWGHPTPASRSEAATDLPTDAPKGPSPLAERSTPSGPTLDRAWPAIARRLPGRTSSGITHPTRSRPPLSCDPLLGEQPESADQDRIQDRDP